MMATALLSLVIPVSLGVGLVYLLWPRQKWRWSHLPVILFSGVGIGIGLFSCFFFLWLLFFGPSSRGLLATLAALLGGVLAALVYRIRKRRDAPPAEPVVEQQPKHRIRWLLAAPFIIMLTFGLASFVSVAMTRPHGEWDAWTVWNVRARFLFRGGDQWARAFSPLMDRSHPENPVLLPGAIAGLWTLIGTDTELVPLLLSALFAFATVGLTVSTLSALRGNGQGLLAGIILLGTPFLITQATWQYADVPLGFFFLATFVFLALHDRPLENKYMFLAIAGLTAGLAAWTKNEGIIFVIAIAAARLITIGRMRGLKHYLRQMAAFGAGLAPVLLIIIYFKVRLAPAHYLMSHEESNPWKKLLDPSRHTQVWDAIVREVTVFGGWSVSIPLLLVFYVLLLGTKLGDREKPGAYAGLVAVALMVVAYSLTYVITPFDINWHLSTSLNRLLLQLWPSFIFGYFLVVRPIESEAGASGAVSLEAASRDHVTTSP
jgi:Dolichyl-phosphate-mannose-protein mannosyltransferase